MRQVVQTIQGGASRDVSLENTMLTHRTQPFVFSFVSSIAISAALGSEALAQTTTVGEASTVDTIGTTETETATESSETTDWTDMPSGSGSSWVPSTAPGYVECPAYGNGSGHPFPGSSGPMPGFPSGVSGMQLIELGYRCSVHTHFGDVRFDCSCGEFGQRQQGQLPYDWFMQRPTHDTQMAGCQELFEQSCGEVEIASASSCANDYGYCDTTLVNHKGGKRASTLALRCRCHDQSAWSVGSNFADPLAITGEMLRDRCEAEVSVCGVEPVGEGLADALGLGPAQETSVACSSAFGRCGLVHREDAQQQLACECNNGKQVRMQGDPELLDPSSSALLNQCGQELALCHPNGKTMPSLGAEQVSTTTGAGTFDASTGTGGGQASAQAPVQFSCSIGKGSQRSLLGLLGLGLLVGLRRRKRA